MKTRLYKFLFRFVSFLTDITNGMSLLVKYKLLVGTFLLSVTHAAAQKEVLLKDTFVVSYLGYETREISVDEILNNSTIIMKEDTTIQMSCYVVIASPIKNNEK